MGIKNKKDKIKNKEVFHFRRVHTFLFLILSCLLITSCKNNQADETIATINYQFQGCFGGGKTVSSFTKMGKIPWPG